MSERMNLINQMVNAGIDPEILGLTEEDKAELFKAEPPKPHMTAEQFLEKYPDSELRENCLQDIACPECGQRDSFNITFTGTAEVYDDGSDDVGDHEWESESDCTCSECKHGGTVADFTFPGLDKLIDGKEEA